MVLDKQMSVHKIYLVETVSYPIKSVWIIDILKAKLLGFPAKMEA